MLVQKPKTRPAITLVELLMLVAIVGTLLALSLPAILQAQEASRRDKCAERMKDIALALLNFENKRKALPPISTNFDPTPDVPGDATVFPGALQAPGSASTSAAGYSWMVLILPEINEAALYQSIAANSVKFTLPAFAPQVMSNFPNNPAPHAATVQLPQYLCPEFTGGPAVDTAPRVAGVAGGDIETGSAPPNYVAGIATANGAKGIAMTNYNAMLGTHIDNHGPLVGLFPLRSASLPNSNNGAMMFRGMSFDLGRKLAAISDGTSKTIVVAETRERRFGSWYDGTMNWVVAARHSNPAAGTTAITAASRDSASDNQPSSSNRVAPVAGPIGPLRNDRWLVGTDTTPGGAALNYGPKAATPTAVYLPTAALADPDITAAPPGRLWGPSSQHKGGIVNHVFADAHVESIADNIDANVYLWLVTRNAGEVIPAN